MVKYDCPQASNQQIFLNEDNPSFEPATGAGYQKYYGYYHTHDNVYPADCALSGPYAGCHSESGCELWEPDGFPYVIGPNDQHAALSCKCIEGFEFSSNQTGVLNTPGCTRIEIQPTQAPTNVIFEREVSMGRLRLVQGEGQCQDVMSGRIEVQLTAPYDFKEQGDENQYHQRADGTHWVDVVERQEDMWYTLDHSTLDSYHGEAICKTIFGNGANYDTLITGSQCGSSEARVIAMTCPQYLTLTEKMSYPDGCQYKGPYKGCTTPGCELTAPYGFDSPHGSDDHEAREFFNHAAIQCRCRDGFALNETIGDCYRIDMTSQFITPTPQGVVKTVNTTLGRLRLVNEGVCEGPMSGRVEVRVNDIYSISSVWNNFVEPRPDEWFTIEETAFIPRGCNYNDCMDDGSQQYESQNVCKTMFSNGARINETHFGTQCGGSESRVLGFVCHHTTERDYGFNYPDGCTLEGPYRGCTEVGCELDENEGVEKPNFWNVPDNKQHMALSCRCRDGFAFNDTNSECYRLDFPEIVDTVELSSIVRQVNTTIGKLRLVNEGNCTGPMSGRVEVQLTDVFATGLWNDFVEPYPDQWFSVRDDGFYPRGCTHGNCVDGYQQYESTNVCKTLFSNGARINETLFETQCGGSEARVWNFICHHDTERDFGNNYPDGCTKQGPYEGCTGHGCELDEQEGATLNAIPEIEQHFALNCRCRDGFYFDDEICVRKDYPELLNATDDGVVKTVDLFTSYRPSGDVGVHYGQLRMVNEGNCTTPMSGRVEVKFDDVFTISTVAVNWYHNPWNNIDEPRADEWITIRDSDFYPRRDHQYHPYEQRESNNVCKTMFTWGAKLDDTFYNSECGVSESRVFGFTCQSDWKNYRDPGHIKYNFPYGCHFAGPYEGCTGLGCELDEDEGAVLDGIPDSQQHVAVSCKCRDGFTYSEITGNCDRDEFPGLTTATPAGIVKVVDNDAGKIRLVNDGACLGPMTGRVEQFLNNVYAYSTKFYGYIEPRVDEWFSIADDAFLDGETRAVCKTFFGYGAKNNQTFTNSTCGTSESRVWKYDCPDPDSAYHLFRYGFSFPAGCSQTGPYKGCTGFGCELDEGEGSVDWDIQESYQHVAVSCECRDGFSFNETSAECQRWEFPEFTTPTPSGVVKTVETNPGYLRLVNEGVCQDPMSGRIEVKLNDVTASDDFSGGNLYAYVVEKRDDEWLTLGDDQLEDADGAAICKTMFGTGAKVKDL